MMCWMSRFDLLLGERLECRVLAAPIHLMIHRLSRSPADTNTDEPLEITMLMFLFGTLSSYTRKNSEDVWKIVDSVIVNTPIFSQHETSKYDGCFGIILGHYGAFVMQYDFPSRIHASSSTLQLFVIFLTTQWSTLHTSTRTRATLTFLVTCLEWRFRLAYDVFYKQRCLKFLAMQSVSSWSVSLLKAYIVGITVAIQSHDDPEENEMIFQAIDHLHEAENLFFVCSIFVMYPHDSVPQARGNPDIMTVLARIRPLDPAWVNCRQKLRELAEDENFLAGLGGEESDPEERRCNIHVALERLEVFFSDIPPQSTASLELSGLPPQPQPRLARVGRLLPSSCRRPRQQDEEHQLTEHV
ncbi:hypothetical protein F5146DRAFT_12213 [Armillaria mellea]|nr:hypothetical protein F5146DRAFT_12213 [Armillaria mellea]